LIAESSFSKRLRLYRSRGTGTATVQRAHHVIASLIIGDHHVTPASDQTMELSQSKVISPQSVRSGFLSDRDWDKCAGIISVDAWSVASMDSGLRNRDGGGVKTSATNSVDRGVSQCPDHRRHQLQAVRRRLWILSATLESLPAKIELAGRTSGVLAEGDGPDQAQHGRGEPGDLGMARKADGILGGWWARWRLAWLRSRADRAERSAAVAIHDASASFGAALEAVLHAAVARVKADGACRGPCCIPAPWSRDQGDDRHTVDLLERNSS
jgi:hypothetical protein